ncbi:SgcJ/EcaC family oxidoreductase [Streptomyces boluensis]|uniref:SgcJ/EcaC family oxidoreductase n=1 Tax=Streptomyces boluensis TaxID=1775135 RepID=A0A964UJ61_9ACTN|nr:SgcJ/EcaC family oxidoreductase [Streptomyces boluensis]NBE49976.1 SgcJ/EcaC family oxidoreductase [Streptomyces boluensis]
MSQATAAAPQATEPQALPQLVVAAWADNDADAFAELFTEDATLILPGDIYAKGKEAIRELMRAGYAGPYRGTKVTGTPIDAKVVGGEVAILVTEGGVIAPGEEQVAPERAIRATWVLAEQDGGWRITAYQNTPRAGA